FRCTEVSGKFGRRGHAYLPWRSGHQLPLPLLRPEEEGFVPDKMVQEFPWQSDRPADVVADVIVAIQRPLAPGDAIRFQSVGIVEERVGIEPLMPVEQVARAMKILAPAPSADLDFSAASPPVLALIV